MTDQTWDAMLRAALLDAARLDADALGQDAQEEPPSPDHQARMGTLLQSPQPAPHPPRRTVRPWWLRCAACLALVLALGLGGTMTLNANARDWVVRMFSQRFADHSAFSFQSDSSPEAEGLLYRPTYLPEGYTEREAEPDASPHWAFYEDGQDRHISFSYLSGNAAGTVSVDNEHSVETITTIGDGCQAHLLETTDPRYPSFLIWMDEEKGAAFVLDGFIPPEELIKIAESVCAQ